VSAPDAPDLPDALADGTLDALDDEARVSEVALAGVSLPGQRARAVTFSAVTLDDADVSGSRLDQLSLVDVRVTGGNWSNVQSRAGRALRASFADTRATGLAFTDAELRDVVFRDCRADLCAFARGRLERVSFEGCVLSEADFSEADLRRVSFVDCDLQRADFRGARMTECTMHGVTLEGLAGVEGLRGVTMPWADIVANAATWAAALGLHPAQSD
jgi:uncharacterized protein YjbI with pentapeptide repeats